ncbi:MAG: DUF4445 domain-containing protein [Coriobacteriia bacterium]|nr:DUF4445 domain-containing protein [Coriobacteriia bacterium]
MPQVTFTPEGTTVVVGQGENLLRAAMLADVRVSASCGGDGTCGKCKMVVESGSVDTKGSAKLTREEVAAGYVLSCVSTVTGDVTVRVPIEARPGQAPARGTSTRRPNAVLTPEEHAIRLPKHGSPPPVAKRVLRMNEPTVQDNVNDATRVRQALKRTHGVETASITLPALRELPYAVREGEWVVTAFASEPCDSAPVVTGFQAGDTSARHYAVAVDVGTTTVEIALVDLNTGDVVASASEYNAQVSRGEDVISRVIASTKPGGLEDLEALVIGTIKGLVEQALSTSGVSADDIVAYYVAGNTVMSHLLLGISPEFIRTSPYVPAASTFPWMRAADFGLPAARATRMYVVPCPASWLGGDIVAGLVAAGVPWTEKLTLFIDVGTNGEIVLGNNEWLVSCSCSAGPAFEGGGILHGMRAANGAIEQVRIDDETLEPTIMTIGGVKPLGICGSGLIDTAAELFMCGALGRDGKFRTDHSSPYLVEGERGLEYVLASAEESATGKRIVLTEVDVENLMRAKAAIYSGIAVLVESLDLSMDDIEEVVIAGGFGHYLDLERVVALGMVPEIAPERFVFLGNGSLLGAKLVAGSREVLRTTKRTAETVTYLELSVNAGFMDNYTSALFLPHTNLTLFPRTEEIRAARLSEKAVV